ncbi:hypothetical protein [Desulfurivibrio sp. C05AmB]|uniref:hypothetical protein n=1 Tax=Desulfurivibrio sp. C05AmB TaxID=3374371 RepID=UPI00376EC418
MTWWQALIVALSTLVVTKVLDLVIAQFTEKREFNRFRREKITEEIETLKNEIGMLFELTANWKAFDEKQKSYFANFENDHELVGKFNKYPSIAQAARDTVHWCRIVASCEMSQTNDLIENKKEMGERFRKFLKACDDYINNMA